MLATALVLSLLGQAPSPDTDAVRDRAWVPALAGAVIIAGGVTFVIIARAQTAEALATPDADLAARRMSTASLNLPGGVALIGAGLGALAVAAIMAWWSPPLTRLSLAPLREGALLSLQWQLP